MPKLGARLSVASLVRAFWRPISITWALTILETAMLVALPLLIGQAIDGLLAGSWTSFLGLVATMAVLLIVAVCRRIYDTRVYGSMGVEFSTELAGRSKSASLSQLNARLGMGTELVTFLETEVPAVMTALIHLVATVSILLSFHIYLAASASVAILLLLLIYAASSGRFFAINRAINQQTEQQVTVLTGGSILALSRHLLAVRRHAVRLSDTEAVVYGLIFAVLLSMLGINLWFAATQIDATPGQIFSIVTYSYELMGTAVVLPATLQSLTRLSEITERINGVVDG